MKKYIPAIAILGVIFVILVIVAIVIVSTVGKTLGEKVSLNNEEFISKIEEMGYTTKDVKSQFSSYDYIKTATLAHEKDRKYKIEFYTMESDEGASYFFSVNKAKFEESQAVAKSKTKANGKNHNKFTFTADGKYKVVSRIGNTCLYANVDVEYKEEVKNLIKELGY